MRYFYDPETDQFGETRGEVPKGAVELDPVRAEMFVQAELAGQRIDRSRIDEFRLDPAALQARAREARRIRRNQLLAASDWTQLPDALADRTEIKQAWATYRQALRDMDFDDPQWPQEPRA